MNLQTDCSATAIPPNHQEMAIIFTNKLSIYIRNDMEDMTPFTNTI